MEARRELLTLRANRVQERTDGDEFDAEFLNFLRWLATDPFMAAHLSGLIASPDVVGGALSEEGEAVRRTFIDVLKRLTKRPPVWLKDYLSGPHDEVRSPIPPKNILSVLQAREDIIAAMVHAVEGVIAAYDDAEHEMRPKDVRDEEISAIREGCRRWKVARREWKHSRVTNTAVNVRELFVYARRLLKATGDRPEWLRAVTMSKGEAAAAAFGSLSLKEADDARAAIRPILARVTDDLQASLLTTLDRTVLVARFAQRATMYDAERLRALKEDDLTLELARYLHDAGVLALPVYMGPRRPDLYIPGTMGFVVESKRLVRDGKSKQHALRGFWQIHSYLTTCESGIVDVNEGVVALFRVDGPNMDAPPFVQTPRFRLHCKPIDIGDPSVTGSRQSRPAVKITEEEIIACVEKSEPPEVD